LFVSRVDVAAEDEEAVLVDAVEEGLLVPFVVGVSVARVEEVGLLFVVSDGREEEFTAGFAVVVETAGRGGIVIGGQGGMVMGGSAVSAS
jgi:hypothetical protein